MLCDSPYAPRASNHCTAELNQEDPSGELDKEEFIQLVMAKGKTPEEEMKETWKFFDVDAGGDIDREELKEGLARVGVLLAPWELDEMWAVLSLLACIIIIPDLSAEQRSIHIMISAFAVSVGLFVACC